MNKVTEKDLQVIITRINTMTGSPDEEFAERDPDGSVRHNVGNYHLGHGYGGVKLERCTSVKGGTHDVLGTGYTTKRGLRDGMWAFINGYHTARDAATKS